MSTEMFTQLPTVSEAQLSDIVCAVTGYVSTSIPGTSVQQTLQQVINLALTQTILSYAGNPNGNVAGSTYQLCYDTSDSYLYICTTSGAANTAVWTFIGSTITPLAQGGTNHALTASLGGIVYSDASKLDILAGTSTSNLPVLSQNAAAPVWGSYAIDLGGTLTTGGAFTTSGAYTVTQTYTGNTNVTFPTSGTLATTSASVQTVDGDSGSATPSSGTLTISGGMTGLTTSASGSTVSLTGTLGPTYGGTGVNNGSSTITIGGNVAFSGAHTFTGTLTGNTNVTFPTSGTLATTSSALITIDADSGSATVSSGVITISGGTTGLTTTGSSSTIDLTGILKLTNGGTNSNLTAVSGALAYSTASAIAFTSAGSSGQIIQSAGSGEPIWSTATYPSTAGTQYNVLQSTGTNITSATLTSVIDGAIGSTQGDILYRGSSSWNALSPSAQYDVLQCGGSSANPSWSTLSTLIDNAIGSTQGDILYRNSTVWAVLSPGTSGYFLQTQGSSANPQWASGNAGTVTSIATNDGITGGTITSTGTIGLAAIANNTLLANTSGGSLYPSSTTLTALIDAAIGNTQGNILYRNSSSWVALAPGSSGQVLSSGGSSANISWENAPGTGTINSGTAGQIAFYSSSGTTVSGLSPNIQLSSSCGEFTGTATSFAQVTNLSVSITTIGGPVLLKLNHDGSNNIGSITCSSNQNIILGYFKGATQLNEEYCSQGFPNPLGSFWHIDDTVAGSPGTYTYTCQYYMSGGTGVVGYAKLVAQEIR